MPGGQAEAEPLSILSLPEVSDGGHGQGGGADRLPQGAPGAASLQAQESSGVAPFTPRVAHHGTGQSTRGHQS